MPRGLRLTSALIRPLAPRDFREAAAILGHKRASVLLDVYAKALRAPKRAAAERLQAALY